jgi:hypothetical protein
LKVTLDSGESFRCTPDHLVMLRDGTYLCAEDLLKDQSVMPLYKKFERLIRSKNDLAYEHVYNPQDGVFHPTHSLIYGPVSGGVVRHHVNFNRLDNRPTNLVGLSWKEHAKIHGANIKATNDKMWGALTPEQRTVRNKKSWAGENRTRRGPGILRTNAATKKRLASLEARAIISARFKGKALPPNQIAKIVESLKKRWEPIPTERRAELMAIAVEAAAIVHRGAPNHRLGERIAWHTRTCAFEGCGNQYTCRNSRPLLYCCQSHAARARQRDGVTGAFMNHKVLCVEALGISEDVYDLEVEGFHNFALSCGVFVHNCSADVLAVWAARHRDQMRKEMGRGGAGLISMEIPMPVIGGTMAVPGGSRGSNSDNPYANGPRPSIGPLSAAGGSLDSFGISNQADNFGGWIGLNQKK